MANVDFCTTCKQYKHRGEFSYTEKGENALCHSCKAILNPPKTKSHKPIDKDQIRNYHYKRSYDLTLDQYNQMFEDQKGCCLTCGTHQSLLSKALAVDHCHKSGRVRGLLCTFCNTALGLVKDNSETLLKMAKYIHLNDQINDLKILS